MALLLLENHGGQAQGFDFKALSPLTWGPLPGQILAPSNGTTQNGKTDIFEIVTVNGKKWMTSWNTGNRFYGPQMAGFIPAGNSTIFVGVRYRLLSPLATATSHGILRLVSSNFEIAYTVPANVAEFYAEFVINREAGTLDLYVDGRFVNTTTITATPLAALRASTDSLNFALGRTAFLTYTDNYFVVDTKDDTINSRMGPIDISDVPLQVSSKAGFDDTAMADVLARKDYATDSGTRVTGSSDSVQAELKLVKKDGYALPNTTQVLGMCLTTKSTYKGGQPGDLKLTHKRGSSSSELTVIQTGSTPAVSNGVLPTSSRSAAEQDAATALNGLEVSLKVVDR